MERYEYDAGANQKIVVLISDDNGGPIDARELFAALADDAAAHEEEGWHIVSTLGLPLRQTGTAGNILFQSGGQFATQAGLAVVYART